MQPRGTRVVGIVSSEAERRATLASVLEPGGFSTVEFSTVEKALHAKPPDLFVAGLSAPDLEGWRLCSLLRFSGDAAWRSIPILLVSSGIEEEEACRITAELGGNGVVPFAAVGERLLVRARELMAAGATDVPSTDQASIQRLNRLYAVLGQVNQAIARASSRDQLFEEICQVSSSFGRFRLTWIGTLEEDSKRVQLRAQSTDEQGFPGPVLASECEVAAEAMREGRPCVCNTLSASPSPAACHRLAMDSDIGSCAAFPILFQGRACGALCLHASETGYFNSTVTRLLEEVALDVSIALDKLEEEAGRKRAEEALRQSEAKFASAFLHAPVLMSISALEDGTFLDVNEKFAETSGFGREEIIGKTSIELDWLTPEARARMIEELQAKGCVRGMALRHRGRDGRDIDCVYDGELIEVNGVRRLLSIAVDVTERKRRETEREMTLDLLRLLHVPSDVRELIRSVTGFLQNWTGCEAVGIRLHDGADFPYFETRGFGAEFVEAENFLCARDESRAPLLDDRGNPVLECICGAVLDGKFDPHLPFITWNGNFWTNHAAELIRTMEEADRPTHARLRCIREGYESVALIALRSGGRSLGLLQFNDRRPDRFTREGISALEQAATSLTIALQQRFTQEELRRSEERYRLISENTGDVIWVWDVASEGLTFVSRSVEQLRGFTVEESLRQTLRDALTPESYQKVATLLPARLAAFEAGDTSERVRTDQVDQPCKDGSIVSTEMVTTLLTDASGRVREMVGVTRDITERKRSEAERAHLEDQLRQAQKLESVGRLAGGVAHDFNNLLTVINGYSDLMLARLSAGDPLRDAVTEIHKAGARASALTQQLLAFSRKQVTQPKPVDLNHLIRDTRDMLQRMVGEDVEVVAKLAPSLGKVMADQGQLHQILMNLAVNARDAMPGGGRLSIETANVELDQSYAAVHPQTVPGAYVMLAVSDTGMGMDDQTRQQIFEPFFTTKGEGKGTGLGLSTVYGIVRQCGGWIWVYSEPGQGATFKIYLPRLETPDVVVEAPAKIQARLRGTETVLVVEDQQDVRGLAVEVLRRYGYRVIEAASGGDALLLAERHPGPIHLMLTDVVMPRMTGRELVERLKPQRPQMAVLYMSGYTEDAIAHSGTLDPGVNYLPKPFAPRDLAAKVREVLGPPRSPGSVLVVGDEEGIRHLFQQILAGAGYEVAVAGAGAPALDLVRGHTPDLILADLGSPDGPIRETLHVIRQERPALKIIAVSSPFGGSLRAANEQLDADTTLVKPVTPDQLLEAVRRIAQ